MEDPVTMYSLSIIAVKMTRQKWTLIPTLPQVYNEIRTLRKLSFNQLWEPHKVKQISLKIHNAIIFGGKVFV